jgi:hypothetical protein
VPMWHNIWLWVKRAVLEVCSWNASCSTAESCQVRYRWCRYYFSFYFSREFAKGVVRALTVRRGAAHYSLKAGAIHTYSLHSIAQNHGASPAVRATMRIPSTASAGCERLQNRARTRQSSPLGKKQMLSSKILALHCMRLETAGSRKKY